MKKYIYALLISCLITIIFRIIFSYFQFDSDFLIGWLACTAYFFTLDYHNNQKKKLL